MCVCVCGGGDFPKNKSRTELFKKNITDMVNSIVLFAVCANSKTGSY